MNKYSKTKTFAKVCCLMLISINANAKISQPYFTSKNLSFEIIDKPLDRKSQEYKNEISQIIALQSNPDIAELELAFQEKNFTALTLMKRANIKANPKTHPQLFALLNRVTDTSISVTDDFKNYWQTKRPYLSDKRIKKLIASSKGYAYPSGHTSGSFIFAHVLGMIYPKKYSKLLEIAQEIADHRILVGMHFPHDIVGGKKLALVVVGGLIQNKEFENDLLVAKKELKKNFIN